MVVIPWVILLTDSENLSHNFSNPKGDSVCLLTLGNDNENITGGEIYFGIFWETMLTEDIGRPKTLRELQPLIPWVVIETTMSDETVLLANWLFFWIFLIRIKSIRERCVERTER